MGWKYYNHAMVSDVPPHIETDITEIENGDIWKRDGYPLFARWVSDFDCGFDTGWWYVIKDDEYDIQMLKAKRRYEINKGRKNFKVKIVNPQEYCAELFEVQSAAFSAYPSKYRPVSNYETFKNNIKSWDGVTFAAFSLIEESKKNGILCGYAYVKPSERRINFISQKTCPSFEKYGVNAAIVDAILVYFNDEIKEGKKYISDGHKSVNHETAFQDYLEKYFGFRKAYCKLNIVYRPSVKWFIPILFGMRKALKRFDNIGLIHKINAVMKMEETRRQQKAI